MKKIDFDDQFIYLYDGTLASKLNAKYVKSKNHFKVPLTIHALAEIRDKADDSDFELKSLVIRKGKELVEHYKKIDEYKQKERTRTYDERLRDYQNVDVETIIHLGEARLIFNEQRTGKTPTTIVSLCVSRFDKIVVLCPSGLKNNWEKEFKAWYKTFPTLVVKGTKARRMKLYEQFKTCPRGVLITSYDTHKLDYQFYKFSFECVVADEVHFLRNYKTKRFKAAVHLSRQAKVRYGLTGTPTVNGAEDIYGILAFVEPHKWTSFYDFRDRYVNVVAQWFGNRKIEKCDGYRKDREQEIITYIKSRSIQRKRIEVMKWLPKVIEQEIELDFDDKQHKIYKKLEKDFYYENENGIIDVPIALSLLTRLRQVALDPQLLGLGEGESPKLAFLKEYVETNPDEHIIVFTTFTSFIERHIGEFDKAGAITGKQSTEQKQAVVDKFQRGELKIIFSNIIAGGVGFTLDKADTTIFLDRDYNPVNNQQAQDRFIPTQIGDTKTRLLIDLTMKDSVDYKIMKLLKEKKDIISIINDYNGLTKLLKEE